MKNRPDKVFITKYVDEGNKGYLEIRYNLCHEDHKDAIEDLSFEQLKEIADFLHEYMKVEKGGAR